MEASVYTTEGKEKDTITLPEELFGVGWNADLVHQVVVSMQSNARAKTAHTKDRSEVRGGGRKPWRQKGTGRARHGSRRSPLWRHGGVTHGPRNERNYDKKVNRKMKIKALAAVLSRKFQDNEVTFIDHLPVTEVKTKDAMQALTGISTIDGREKVINTRNAAHIIAPEVTDEIAKSFRNIPDVSVGAADTVNILDVLSKKHLIVISPKESVAALTRRVNIRQKEVAV